MDVRLFDHAAVHAEYEELAQVVGQREYALDHDELVADEYHVERGQTEVHGAEQQLEQYNVAVALVQLVPVEYQALVQRGAVLHVVHQLLFGGLAGRPVALDDCDGVFDVGGQRPELGYHLANEKRERAHDSGDDELDGYNDKELERKRKRKRPRLKNKKIIIIITKIVVEIPTNYYVSAHKSISKVGKLCK